MPRAASTAVVVALGLAVLTPSSYAAHAAPTTYKTLRRPGFTTRYISTFKTGDIAGSRIFHDADAPLFPLLTVVQSPSGNAAVFIGMRPVKDGASQINKIYKTALNDIPTGYHRKGSITHSTRRSGSHIYFISRDVVVSRTMSASRSIYSTVLGGRTFYFFLEVSLKATTAEERGAGFVIGQTQAL